jgi:hypothetical protein
VHHLCILSKIRRATDIGDSYKFSHSYYLLIKAWCLRAWYPTFARRASCGMGEYILTMLLPVFTALPASLIVRRSCHYAQRESVLSKVIYVLLLLCILKVLSISWCRFLFGGPFVSADKLALGMPPY